MHKLKTKQRDVPYCGIRKKNVEYADPKLNPGVFEVLYHFIHERYSIHLKKDVLGLEKPWTKDPIFQQYKFTNVRREHDRQTKELIRLVSSNPELSLEEKIANTFLFRAWNNADTFTAFGGPWKLHVIYDPRTKESARAVYKRISEAEPERVWFSSAYNQGGTKQSWSALEPPYIAPAEPDIPLRVFHVGVWLGRDNVIQRLLASKDQMKCFEVIKSVRGFADFLAYQVFVDLTYIGEFPFSENEFVVAGPGCKRGLELLFDDFGGMSHEEALFWLRDRFELVCEQRGLCDPSIGFFDLDPSDRKMNVMSLENCFCELSKYIKSINNTGRPKVRYDGV